MQSTARTASERLARRTACILLAAHATANAAEGRAVCPSLTVAAGWIHLNPRSSSGPLVLREANGVPVNMPQAGTGVRALSADTVLLTAECAANDNWSLQFVFGVPPNSKLAGSGALDGAGVIGEGRQYSPTWLLKYCFGAPADSVRPFVGLGFSYTFFRQSRITNGAFRSATYGPNATTDVAASSSWNPAYNAGLKFRISDAWSVDTGLGYAPVKTRITVIADNTQAGVPLKVTSEMRMRTIGTSVTLNRRF